METKRHINIFTPLCLASNMLVKNGYEMGIRDESEFKELINNSKALADFIIEFLELDGTQEEKILKCKEALLELDKYHLNKK